MIPSPGVVRDKLKETEALAERLRILLEIAERIHPPEPPPAPVRYCLVKGAMLVPLPRGFVLAEMPASLTGYVILPPDGFSPQTEDVDFSRMETIDIRPKTNG